MANTADMMPPSGDWHDALPQRLLVVHPKAGFTRRQSPLGTATSNGILLEKKYVCSNVFVYNVLLSSSLNTPSKPNEVGQNKI
jgi:hypothetical protein